MASFYDVLQKHHHVKRRRMFAEDGGPVRDILEKRLDNGVS